MYFPQVSDWNEQKTQYNLLFFGKEVGTVAYN